MKIELDEMYECDKCHIIFNGYVVGKRVGSSYYNNFEGYCPLCKEKFMICD